MSSKKEEKPACYEIPMSTRMEEWIKLQKEKKTLETKYRQTMERIKRIRKTDKHLMTVVGDMGKFDREEVTSEEEDDKQDGGSSKKRKLGDSSSQKGGKTSKPPAKERISSRIKGSGPTAVDKSLQESAKK